MYSQDIKDKAIMLYKDGWNTADISEELDVSIRTVQRYIRNYKQKESLELPEAYFQKEDNRVLVIGDLHCPFDRDDYIDFLKEQYKKYNCNKVVSIGDLVDFSAISRHPVEPDAYGVIDELELAKKHLKKYVEAFPEMYICNSNHDIRLYQRANDAGIDSRFMKTMNEILDLPDTWKFANKWEFNDVLYVHGDDYSARNILTSLCDYTGKSTCLGHQHTLAGIIYSQGKYGNKKFAMAVGTGINYDSYAFRYAKKNRYVPIISCGIVINSNEAYIETMKEN